MFSLNYINSKDEDIETEYNFLDLLIKNIMNELPNLATSEGYELIVDTNVSNSQKSAMYNFAAYSRREKDKNIIEKATDLLIRFCRGHFISNGNKRSAVFLALAFMKYHSIIMIKNSQLQDYINEWEVIVHEVTSGCECHLGFDNITQREEVICDTSKALSDEVIHKKLYNFLLSQSYLEII